MGKYHSGKCKYHLIPLQRSGLTQKTVQDLYPQRLGVSPNPLRTP